MRCATTLILADAIACPAALVLRRVDVDPPPFLIEPHDAIDQREERIIRTHANVAAGTELRAALADNNVPCNDPLAAEPLHAAPLRVRVATIAGRALTFLMCH